MVIKQDCTAHHWVISIASSRESIGICKLCGEEKLFTNSFDIDDRPISRGRPKKKGRGSEIKI